MILIFSKNTDLSTYEVIKWLKFFKNKFILICEKEAVDFFQTVEIENNTLLFQFKGYDFSIEDISSIWYRRGGLSYLNFQVEPVDDFVKSLKKFAYLESEKIFDFVKAKLEHIPSIGSSNMTVNKLDLLSKAKELGISIPKTIVTTKKQKLKDFFKLCKGEMITKPAWEVFIHPNKDFITDCYTSLVTIEDLKSLNDTFFPSLFQERINPDFEVRTFFLAGNFYSMATIRHQKSRNNDNVDIRRTYNQKNRLLPFKLPHKVQSKLNELMSEINVNTGSIDLLVRDGKYFFLELNPIGQYDQTSKQCNYCLDKKIAKELIKIRSKR